MPVTQTNCIACGNKLPVPIISNAGQLCNSCRSQGLFRKQIIITGITRMNHGNICVSGIDPQTWRFIRPVFRTGLKRDFAMEGATQVINHFNLVEIEFTKYRPEQLYHTEDWMINEKFAPRFIRHLTNQEIIQVLNKMSITDLDAAMQPQDKSLFIVKVKRIMRIWDELSFDRYTVRINFIDYFGNIYSSIPITDLLTLAFIRFQKNKGSNDYMLDLMNAFNNNPYKYIRIGITRVFQEQYWKQVTALITIPDLFDGRSFSYYENQIGGHA
ncbi:MAG: hypothetical protein A2046_01665 [Bacteroidetes bacterium GWA2_30_7]|nr:MAG: hypothetical protein A2046_01665 [Bacteroidetes bacterium GWA2_30_7]